MNSTILPPDHQTGPVHHAPESALSRYVGLLVWTAVVAAAVLIPLIILGHGFLPQDDVLRHVAKAVSGRPWSEILVLRPEVTVDEHPGWHAILEVLHRTAGLDADSLAALSIGVLFTLVLLVGLPWVRTPEAWIGSLLVSATVIPLFLHRISMGRPFVLWMIVEVFVLGLWTTERFRSGPPALWKYGVTVVVLALMGWIHGAWFLFLLPVGAFALAGQFRQALALALCLAAGTLLGALLTGHPGTFLLEHLLLVRNALGEARPQRVLVPEFRPYSGGEALLILLPLLAWRAARRQSLSSLLLDPVFIMAAVGWLLGLRVARLWCDWGLPAFVLWLARQAPDSPAERAALSPLRRLGLAGFLCAALVAAVTADLDGRWSKPRPAALPLPAEEVFPRDWLPGKGGVVYTADMGIFFELFYKYPRGEWRYIVGYEPGLMPRQDLAVFDEIIKNGYTAETVGPWLSRMTPPDRFVIGSQEQPTIPGLEWRQYRPGLWFGRLPR